MLTRSLGKVLLGKSTPFQLFAACVLGAFLGFSPGPSRGPALLLAWILLIVLANVNLWLVGIVALAAKALSLLALPVTFALGRALLDGPTSPLFRAAINTPVLALFGLEYYTVTGGLLLALLFGGAAGFGLVRLVGALRHGFLDLDEKSDRFRAWANKGWVKLLTWALVGVKPSREAYEKLEGRRIGNPVRPLGVLLVVLLAVVVVGGGYLLSSPIVTAALHSGLERANGATVDLAKAVLGLGEGRLAVEGLAMADPHKLETDVFRAFTLDADLSAKDLLRKRVRFERIVIRQAESGAE
ncbi:MAG: hypothetical protein ACREID_07205, partial [Planctomycetota bacterium]